MDGKLKLTMEIRGNSICFLDLKTSIQSTCLEIIHCVKSVRIQSYSGPYFPAFGLNSLRIQSECGKIRTRITPNKDTFCTVTLYSKPADSHLYLEASSCHRKYSKNDIIKDAVHRLRKICSTMKDFEIKSSEYLAYLVPGRHSAELVKSEFDKVSSMPRHEAPKKRKIF